MYAHAFYRPNLLLPADVCLKLLLLASYRLTLHPLAKYPGPFWARVTDWRLVYHCWRGDSHLNYHEIHCRYGWTLCCVHHGGGLLIVMKAALYDAGRIEFQSTPIQHCMISIMPEPT